MANETYIAAAISNVAQEAVDFSLQQCRATGSDPIIALIGLRDTAEEMVRCATEAIQHIEKERRK
ncbi:MAG: hypothetical protein ACU0CC_04845 [Sagittula sp.]|uniref:hypothetical protein n=1 Tax=Sagittula sp. TaxID=2038081 RepID=UPI004057F885